MLNILHNQVTQRHFSALFAHTKSSTLIIGRRTESDRTADGIQSDGGRNPIGRRTEHDDKTLATIKLCTHYIIYKHNKKVAATSILSEKSSKFAELTATF